MSDNRNQLGWLQDTALTHWLESARLNILQGMLADLSQDPRVRQNATELIRATLEATNKRLAELMNS